VDGPHSAPAEHYTSYGTVMLIGLPCLVLNIPCSPFLPSPLPSPSGAGIGLTPCMSILTALTKYHCPPPSPSHLLTSARYRWRKNFTPEILHFYWVVRHNEIESFQWIVHALAGLFLCFSLVLAHERLLQSSNSISLSYDQPNKWRTSTPLALSPLPLVTSPHPCVSDTIARLISL
jgi:hypothetical protein